jgi:hypothetical protein
VRQIAEEAQAALRRGSPGDEFLPAVRRCVPEELASVADREERLTTSTGRRSGTVGKTSAMSSALGRVITVSAAATMQISAPSIGASSASRTAWATSRAST